METGTKTETEMGMEAEAEPLPLPPPPPGPVRVPRRPASEVAAAPHLPLTVRAFWTVSPPCALGVVVPASCHQRPLRVVDARRDRSAAVESAMSEPIRLERHPAWVELIVYGRVLCVTECDGSGAPVASERSCFDAAAAVAARDRLIAERTGQGWALSEATRARRAAEDTARAEAEVRRAEHQALCEAGDPRAALREHARARLAGRGLPDAAWRRFEEVLARVRAVDEPDRSGFPVRFEGGGSACWSGDTLWLYLEEDQGDHALCFGEDVGPPEGDGELSSTRFAGVPVRWILQELPWDRYWFHAEGRPEVAYCFELDGGLHEQAFEGPPLALLIERIAVLLADA